jgi:hypothetical protein
VVASDRLLRWLCWILVVLVVVQAVLTYGLHQGWFVKFPDLSPTADLVDRLLASRSIDQQTNTLALIATLGALGVFVIAALLGAVLRPLVSSGSARDVMTVVFLLGGVIGVAAQLVNIGVNQAATYGYCDCGYKAEELIAQDYALGVGWTVQFWLALGAITIVGVGAAVAGRLVAISPLWTTLSYLIAIALFLGIALQLLGQGNFADIVIGITSGIAVPIWAILLARGASRGSPGAEMSAA